eukprot:gene1842-3575_t
MDQFCVICLQQSDNTEDFSRGINCGHDHFLHKVCVNGYLSNNVFRQLFTMRENQCCIKCPVPDCASMFDSVRLYSRMSTREKSRYLSIINDVLLDIPKFKHIHNCLCDVLTLKCPSCAAAVDPFPDACSAIMCLNCGYYYCNFCFAAFATGHPNIDRAMAHEHAADHHPSSLPGERSSFLPADICQAGQLKYQCKQVENAIRKLLLPTVTVIESSPVNNIVLSVADMALGILLCVRELEEVGVSLETMWDSVVAEYNQTTSIHVENVDHGNGMDRADSDSDVVHSSDHHHHHNAHRRPVIIQPRPHISTDLTSSSSGRPQSASDTNDDIRNIVNQSSSTSTTDSNTASIPTARSDVVIGRGVGMGVVRDGGLQMANAIKSQNAAAVSQLFHCYRDNLDVDFVDPEHGLPLVSLAVLTTLPEVALQLIHRGADPFLASSQSGRSVLFILIEAGRLDLLRAVATRHPDMDLDRSLTTEIHRYTALALAVKSNHLSIVRYLIGSGAGLDVVEGEHGYSPLALALVMRHELVSKILISAGASVLIPSKVGRTPLALAAEKGLSSVLDLILTDVKTVDINQIVTANGLRLMHIAAYHSQTQVLQLLLEHGGADLDPVEPENGFTPLMMAILGNNPCGALLLIRSGANVRLASSSGRQPMYVAVEQGMSEVVRALVDRGVDINAPMTAEPSLARALHVAVLHEQNQLIGTLVALGAGVDDADEGHGCTPLAMAVLLENETAVGLLLQCGADASIRTKEGRTVLYVAAERGLCGILHLLAKRPTSSGMAVLDAPCSSEIGAGGPLHVAAQYNCADSVWELLRLGADPSVKDGRGLTAIEVAKVYKADAAEAVLLQHGSKFPKRFDPDVYINRYLYDWQALIIEIYEIFISKSYRCVSFYMQSFFRMILESWILTFIKPFSVELKLREDLTSHHFLGVPAFLSELINFAHGREIGEIESLSKSGRLKRTRFHNKYRASKDTIPS